MLTDTHEFWTNFLEVFSVIMILVISAGDVDETILLEVVEASPLLSAF